MAPFVVEGPGKGDQGQNELDDYSIIGCSLNVDGFFIRAADLSTSGRGPLYLRPPAPDPTILPLLAPAFMLLSIVLFGILFRMRRRGYEW